MSNTVTNPFVLVLYTGGTIGMKKRTENEECTLHLDLFLAELKRLPVLHDTAASDVSLEDRGYSVAERLAMPRQFTKK